MTSGTACFKQKRSSRLRLWRSYRRPTLSWRGGAASYSRLQARCSRPRRFVLCFQTLLQHEQEKAGSRRLGFLDGLTCITEQKYGKVGKKIELPSLQLDTPRPGSSALAQAQAQTTRTQATAQHASSSAASTSVPPKPLGGLSPPGSGRGGSIASSDGEGGPRRPPSKSVSQLEIS